MGCRDGSWWGYEVSNTRGQVHELGAGEGSSVAFKGVWMGVYSQLDMGQEANI